MHIAIVISSLQSGGAERVASVWGNRWVAVGRRVSILTLAGEAEPFYSLDDRINVIPLDVTGKSATASEAFRNNVRRIWKLRGALLDACPDVVVGVMDKTNVLTVIAAIGSNIPVVVTEHIDPEMQPVGPIWSWLRKWTYSRASHLVAPSRGIVDKFEGRWAVESSVIHNPAIVEAGKAPATGRRMQNIVLGMGRLVPQKGFDLLLRAFDRIAGDFPDWKLVIWGEGDERPRLLELRKNLQLKEKVELPGVTDRPHEEMRGAELFVLSSRFEGFGNVLVEAMACGLPVVSFQCPSGPEEIVRHGIDGLLVPPEDIDGLAGAMQLLMENGSLREKMGRQAIEARERFSADVAMQRWEKVLRKVVVG